MKNLFANVRGDITGGITAGVVALPLALALGVASGVGPMAGMYGAIAVGFFCGTVRWYAIANIRPDRANGGGAGRFVCQFIGRRRAYFYCRFTGWFIPDFIWFSGHR